MFTPWKSSAAVLVAGLLAASSANAGDQFRMAHFANGPYRQTSYGGHGYCPNPWRCYPGLNLGIGSTMSVLIFIAVAVIAFVFIKVFGTAAPGSDTGRR